MTTLMTNALYALVRKGFTVHHAATAKEAGIQAEKQYLPITIVEDGYVSEENLQKAGKDRLWLDGILRQHQAQRNDVLLLTVDCAGHVAFLRKEQP